MLRAYKIMASRRQRIIVVSRSAQRICFAPASFAAIFTLLSFFWATQISAQQALSSTGNELQEITVTARKTFPDEEVTERVEMALHDDPYVLDTHVTITTKNGVVTLHGFVFDYWELRSMMRLARKIPGVKRVANDLELKGGAPED
jgi:hypothetical protein